MINDGLHKRQVDIASFNDHHNALNDFNVRHHEFHCNKLLPGTLPILLLFAMKSR